MLNKKTLLPLLALAGALFVIYSIAQASNSERPADDVSTIEQGKNPCSDMPKNPCHPDMPENPCHPKNPCGPQNPCHYSAESPQQDGDQEQAHPYEPNPNEEDAH